MIKKISIPKQIVSVSENKTWLQNKLRYTMIVDQNHNLVLRIGTISFFQLKKSPCKICFLASRTNHR